MRNRAAVLLVFLAATVQSSSAFAGSSGGAGGSRSDLNSKAAVTRSESAKAATTKEAKGQTSKGENVKTKADASNRAQQVAANKTRTSLKERRLWKMAKASSAWVGGTAAVAAFVAGGFGIVHAIDSADSNQTKQFEQRPYVQLHDAAPGSSDAQFNDLAGQVRQVAHSTPEGSVNYTDHMADSVTGFHKLASVVLSGKLGADPKYAISAINIGQSLSADLKLRAANDQHPTDTAQVDADTAMLKAKVNQLLAPAPGPASIPAGLTH